MSYEVLSLTSNQTLSSIFFFAKWILLLSPKLDCPNFYRYRKYIIVMATCCVHTSSTSRRVIVIKLICFNALFSDTEYSSNVVSIRINLHSHPEQDVYSYLLRCDSILCRHSISYCVTMVIAIPPLPSHCTNYVCSVHWGWQLQDHLL